MSLILTRDPPRGVGRRTVLARLRAPVPGAPLPEALDAQEAHDTLLTHGYAALAIALHLAHRASDARRLGERLLAAATALAGGGQRGDYRGELGAASVRDIHAVARAGAWLYACGRAGCTTQVILSPRAAEERPPVPLSMDEAARAVPASRAGPQVTSSPSVETPRPGAVEPTPLAAPDARRSEVRPAIVRPAAEGALANAAPPATAAHGGPGSEAQGPETGPGATGLAPGAGPVYVHDPADYYVADPTPLPGEAASGQLPAYVRGWLAGEGPPPGTEAARAER